MNSEFFYKLKGTVSKETVPFGGNNRARTCDPLLVRQMLSQLSYAPVYEAETLIFTAFLVEATGLEPAASWSQTHILLSYLALFTTYSGAEYGKTPSLALFYPLNPYTPNPTVEYMWSQKLPEVTEHFYTLTLREFF